MRELDYIDARLMAKAIARWRVVGDLSDEELQEDSTACRYLNRRIAEKTEEFVPDAIAAIKALGATPIDQASEIAKLRGFLDRIAQAEDRITHYAYGRTPDEQVGQAARLVLKEYRLQKEQA